MIPNRSGYSSTLWYSPTDNYPADRRLLSPKPFFFHPFRFAHEPVLPKGKPTERCCWIYRVVSKMDSSAIIIRVATTIILNILLPLYYSSEYYMLSCHWPSGLLLSMSGHGIFNMCNDLSACYAHESKAGIEGSAQVLTQ